MAYLIVNDLKRFIQSDNLQQLVNKDLTIIDAAMLDAQDVCVEHLIQKYVLDTELNDTDTYDPLVAYKAGDRIYLDAPAYSDISIYPLKSLVLQAGNVYICTVAIVVPEVFNIAHWTLLGVQFDFFYVPYPKPVFVLNKYYKTGDQVYWNGKTYTCVIATRSIDHETLLQFNQTINIPSLNIFPDDTQNGIQYWGTGTNFTVAANSLPTGFNSGDNRNRSLVRSAVAIAIYFMHDRIAPRNIPELRSQRYKAAIQWLKDASGSGNSAITAKLQLIQPRSGGRIRWGGNIKNTNSY